MEDEIHAAQYRYVGSADKLKQHNSSKFDEIRLFVHE
jgi:hypothetical protein